MVLTINKHFIIIPETYMRGMLSKFEIPARMSEAASVSFRPNVLWLSSMEARSFAGISTKPIKKVLRKISPARLPELSDKP